MSDVARLQEIRQRWGTARTGPHSLDTEAQDYADVLWLVNALTAALAPTTCPVCDGAGIVDTSPPGVEHTAPCGGAHPQFIHPNGDTCIWIDGEWFVPVDAGGEGYDCEHRHPTDDDYSAAEDS